MGLLKKFHVGERIKKLPAISWNEMAKAVERLRNELTTIEDDRKPKAKSPVIVRLVFDGATAIGPGRVVKLGAAVFDPTTDESAPFAGLQFHCDVFAESDPLGNYAITMGPIAGGGTGVGYGIMPEAYWAKVSVSDASHMTAKIVSAGTLLESAATGALPIIWKPSGTGEKWCVVSLSSAAVADHFQVIRGVTTAAVIPADATFQIESVTAFEEHASAPDEPVTIAAPAGGVTLAIATAVWAIYRADVGGAGVNWLMFEPGSSTTPPLRAFELTATKTLAQNMATVKWLDDAGNLIGSNVTLYDPGFRFSGRIANYVGSETGFRGYALLRTDLGAVEADRWEIVTMESFAEFIVVKFYTADAWIFVSNESDTDEWMRRLPVAVGGVVTITDPAEVLHDAAEIATDQKLLARLADPDTDSPTYFAVSLKSSSDVAVTLKDITSIDLSFSATGVLKVQINYREVHVYGTVGSSSNLSDTLAIWQIDATNVVTDVSCVADAIVLTEESINILIPPA